MKIDKDKTIQTQLSEAALQSIFNVVSEAIMLIDLQGKVLSANETSARRLGKELHQLIGSDLIDILPIDLYRSREKWVNHVLETKKQVIFQDQRAGREYANALYPVFNENGEMVKVAIFSQDITLRLQAEAEQEKLRRELEHRVKEQTQALRESEARYRAVAELTSDYIFQASLTPGSEYQLLWSTDSIQQITGYSVQEINRLGWDSIVHKDDLIVVETERARLTAGFPFTGNLRIINRQGNERWLQIHSQPIWDKSGTVITGYFSAAIDVTGRIRADMKLSKRLEIERVLAEVAREFIHSHDIDNSILITLARTCHITNAGRARFYLANRSGNIIQKIYTGANCKQDGQKGSVLPASISIPEKWHLELIQGNPIQIPNTKTLDENDAAVLDILERLNVFSLLLMPVRSESDLLGCLSLEEVSGPISWDEEMVSFLEVESQMIGSALNRLQFLETLEQRIHARTRHLTTLYGITTVASHQLDVYSVLEHTIDRVLEAMNSRVGCIHLLNEDDNEFILAAKRWISPSIADNIYSIPFDDPLWRQIIREEIPVMIFDIKTEPQASRFHELEGVKSFVGVRIQSKRQVMGTIAIFLPELAGLTEEDVTLLAAIADQIGISLENIRLRKQAEQAAVLEERQRLGRELHDSVTQSLYSLSLFSQVGINYLENGEIERSKHFLKRIGETTQEALKEMRLLIYELRPAALEREGLLGALRHRLEVVEKRLGIETNIKAPDSLPLPALVETGLFHIAQEALNNALKHSGAQVTTITIHSNEHMVELKVEDNGCGFDQHAIDFQPGIGIASMQERAELFSGILEINSTPGQGTVVRVTWNRNTQRKK